MEMFSHCGLPRTFLTDQGKQFTGVWMQDFMSKVADAEDSNVSILSTD